LAFNWVITKSQPHADSLVIQLRRQGLTATALPCIDHQWNDWPDLTRASADPQSLLFVTSRAVAARLEAPSAALVAAIAPATSATLEARGIRVDIEAHGGARELANAVAKSERVPTGGHVFYPTSNAALRQPEHLAAVAELGVRLHVHVHAVYRTDVPPRLAEEIESLNAAGAAHAPPAFVFWSPSAIENFAAAGGFQRPQRGPVVLVGGSSERAWREQAPSEWRHANRHDADTPLAWSLRFLERTAQLRDGS
jgi:uroporphyrinogen-III synthase